MSGSNTAIPLWLDGQEKHTEATFDVTSPGSGKVLYASSSASVDDAQAAIASAQEAYKTWSKSRITERRDILLRTADVLMKRKDELFKIDSEETGAADSFFEFIFNDAYQACKDVAGLISSVRGSVPNLTEEGKSAMIIQEPYGVVLGIAPWNAPWILGLRACIGPLAMGNTVILKGSEFSPKCYWALGSILHEAGLPKGCLNTLIHRPEDAAAVTSSIIASPVVKKISFTGSTNTGAIIASLAGKYLKPVLLELGGKAPTIVCEDADIEKAALGATLGSFIHGGQVCMCTERILVHAAIADKFKETMKAMAENIFGNASGLVLINEPSVVKNRKLLDDAIAKGAKVIYGDAEHKADNKSAMRPVIIENVKEGMDIYYTESFGPTVSVFTVQSDEEAIKIANDTDYGLSAAVFTENLQRGLRIAKQIESGAVHINTMTVHDEPSLPHGGYKKSGFGRFNSTEGLAEWVQQKVITWHD